jgi:UDP-hydrolysing UDP-N-acetyl-D-glucosamine 2-epimerase
MTNKKIRIAVVLVDRANYGRLKPVMVGLREHPDVDLHVICAGTMLLGKYGKTLNVLKQDGFDIAEQIYMEVEGSVPSTMAKSVGFGVIEFTGVLQRLQPDFVVMIGDRYEAISAAIATVYQNLCLIHFQGGEVTGSIDELTRHAITKLAHYHVPATQRSCDYVLAMGEDPKSIVHIGCPSVDVINDASKNIPEEALQSLSMGVGPSIDFDEPYLMVIFHPVTTEVHDAEEQMKELLSAIHETGIQTILLWPNIDAGSDTVAQEIRRFREQYPKALLHAYKNFEPEVFISVLSNAICAVGNSSSFIRDGSVIGVPVVLVGSRQDGREWGEAVTRVEPVKTEIIVAIEAQVKVKKYPASELYGKPGISKEIVGKLVELKPYAQKKLYYTAD